MATTSDLAPLKYAVDRAQAEERRPPREGETKHVRGLSDHLEDHEWQLVWQVVRALRDEHPEVFVRFTETTLGGLVIDELVELDDPTLEELAARLREVAESEGPWLVSTPLTNIVTKEPAARLADDVVLWRAVLGTEWMDEPFGGGAEDDSEFEVHRFLGDRLSRVTRWLRVPGDDRLDTGVGAQLLTVEEGTASLAINRARSRAQYAIAVWAILAPPEGWKVLPDVGIWIQQPRVQLGQRFKPREHEAWIAREGTRGNAIRHWGEFRAPGEDLLRIPFAAMDNLERRSSQALLSAALAAHQASRMSRFLLSERVRATQVAIECLCEQEPGNGHAFERWSALAEHLRIWDELAVRGYAPDDAQVLQDRLRDARNVATHGADAVLVDLGYPEDRERQMRGSRVAAGRDLAVAAVQSDLSPLGFAVRFALEKLLLLMSENEWDDSLFEAQFQPPGRVGKY